MKIKLSTVKTILKSFSLYKALRWCSGYVMAGVMFNVAGVMLSVMFVITT